jgi:hypothetical protein
MYQITFDNIVVERSNKEVLKHVSNLVLCHDLRVVRMPAFACEMSCTELEQRDE